MVSDRIVHAHLATMWRLNIVYDVLPRESEILHLQFWATAFELLKAAQGDLLRDRRQEQGLLGDAGVGVPRRRRVKAAGGRRQQSHRALERHGDVCRQGHRVSALEVRAAGQRFLLPAVAHVSERARGVGFHGLSRRTIHQHSGAARESIT